MVGIFHHNGRQITMPTNNIIAEIRSYSDFTAALRAWIATNNTTYESINAIAGLQDGYLAKMIAATPVRSFSRISLGATLGALGVKLLLVVDAEKLAAIRPQFTPRKKNALNSMLSERVPVKRPYAAFRGNPVLAKMLHDQWMVRSTPQRRRKIAAKAAKARWSTANKSPLAPQ